MPTNYIGDEDPYSAEYNAITFKDLNIVKNNPELNALTET